MADRVKAQEMLFSDQLWSKLTVDEQISMMRVSRGMSPWIGNDSLIDFQYWNRALAKYMDQEFGLEPTADGYLDPVTVSFLSPKEAVEQSFSLENNCTGDAHHMFDKMSDQTVKVKSNLEASHEKTVGDEGILGSPFEEINIEGDKFPLTSMNNSSLGVNSSQQEREISGESDCDLGTRKDPMVSESHRKPSNRGQESIQLQDDSGDPVNEFLRETLNMQKSINQELEPSIKLEKTLTVEELNYEARLGRQKRDRNILGKPPEEGSLTKIVTSIQQMEQVTELGDQNALTELCIETSYNSISERGNTRFSKLDFQVRHEFYFSEDMRFEFAPDIMDEWVDVSTDRIEVRVNSSRMNSVSSWENCNAYYMFDEMPVRDFKGNDSNTQLNDAYMVMGIRIFDLGPLKKSECGSVLSGAIVTFDPGGIFNLYATGVTLILSREYDFVELLSMFKDFFQSIDRTSSFTFDPGGAFGMLITGLALDFRGFITTIEAGIVEQRLQWDPGGIAIWQNTQE